MTALRQSERDLPENRGARWEARAEEMRERDNYRCQSCGALGLDHPDALPVHHVVKGRHLPQSNARVWRNLVTLCWDCHYDFEGLPPLRQYRRLAQHDGEWQWIYSQYVSVIELLQGGWIRKKELVEKTDCSRKNVKTILANLVPMCVAEKNESTGKYRAIVAAVAQAEHEYTELELERVEQKYDRWDQLRFVESSLNDELEASIEETNGHLSDVLTKLDAAVLEIDAHNTSVYRVKRLLSECRETIEDVTDAEMPTREQIAEREEMVA